MTPYPPGLREVLSLAGLRAIPVLFGATGSGKTDALFRLFGPGSPCPIPAEVVSADSMQVFRGMDIGTAKPSPREMEMLPHHLIDIRDPSEPFSVGEFVRLALAAIADIAARGRLPVVSGGTGFYLKALILGLPESPPSDAAIRESLRAELQEKGATVLMEELALADPASAERIHVNDEYRLLRALEVFRLCGRPLSAFDTEGPAESRLAFAAVGISRPRDELCRRIDERCRLMFECGLPGEVRALFEAGRTPRDPGLRAIGYREFFVEDGTVPGGFRLSQDTDGVCALVAGNSRRYAKRQITFFASLPGAVWAEAASGDDGETAARVWRGLSGRAEKIAGFLA